MATKKIITSKLAKSVQNATLWVNLNGTVRLLLVYREETKSGTVVDYARVFNLPDGKVYAPAFTLNGRKVEGQAGILRQNSLSDMNGSTLVDMLNTFETVSFYGMEHVNEAGMFKTLTAELKVAVGGNYWQLDPNTVFMGFYGEDWDAKCHKGGSIYHGGKRLEIIEEINL